MTKTTFFSFISPFSCLLPHGQVKHCSMRQSKVGAENVQHARDLVVNHLGCDIWDVRKFAFYPKKCRQFHHWNLHIFLYRLFIACIQCILSSEWSWNSYCSSVCSCPQHVVEWPCGQVGPKKHVSYLMYAWHSWAVRPSQFTKTSTIQNYQGHPTRI